MINYHAQIIIYHPGKCAVFMKMLISSKINTLRELQFQTQEELEVLLPSMLDRAFKGEL